MSGSGTGPGDYLEDVPSAFCQMGNNHIIIIALIGEKNLHFFQGKFIVSF